MTEPTTDIDQAARPGLTRRHFFMASGVAAAGVAVAACSSNSGTTTASTSASAGSTASSSAASSSGGGDGAIAMFGAGLELLAVQTYKAGLDAATAGKLGAVPPAVGEFAKTAMAHHQAASDALAKAGGGTPVVPANVKATVDGAFAKVTDVAGLAKLALDLELIAAATYLDVLPKLTTKPAIDLVGSILPIERQHAAILTFALGQYPVPDTFATTDKSVAPK